MDQQKRIENALAHLSLLSGALNIVQIPLDIRGELHALLTALEAEIALAPNREVLHTMITATKLDLYKKTENTDCFTQEQKEHYRKVINFAADAIELCLDGDLFIDRSNLHGK